ncbi:BBE domain-containing protein [Bradyrhizobium sp.]|jgi:hypothetical protein|uniref:BBE domain-containing protein n=2 Tax=Bradyrhizobium sp. TaxID=376 RepID=UPI003C59B03B
MCGTLGAIQVAPMKSLLVLAVLLAASDAPACELSLVAPATSALKNPVQVHASTKVVSDTTAFVHRGNTRYLIQYFMQWESPGATETNIATMQVLYASMRPYVSGASYANYCDLDLGEGYAKAYWGENLARLMKIKSAFDPKNIFRHAQSVPLLSV